MKDEFFYKKNCDRCKNPLNGVRIMSWFTEETICMSCSEKEYKIKQSLIVKGKGTMEGCGYVPDESI